MDISVLYLQPNEEIATSIRNSLTSREEIEFLSVSTAADAFEMLASRPIFMVLADNFIPDMKLMEFVDKCYREYPNTILNICMDTKDPQFIPQVAAIPTVKKIFLPPWNTDEIIDGVTNSVDYAKVRFSIANREEELNSGKANLENSLRNLTEALRRQKNSYARLSKVLNPLADSLVRISMAQTSSDTPEMKALCNLAQRAGDKLLRYLTIGSLTPDDVETVIGRDIAHEVEGYENLKPGEAISCLMGDVSRSKLALICYSMWLVAAAMPLLLEEGKLSVVSRYSKSSRAEFRFLVKDYVPKAEVDEKTVSFLDSCLYCISQTYEKSEKEGNLRFDLTFEV